MDTSGLVIAGLISAGGAVIILALLIVVTTERWNLGQTLIWVLVIFAIPVLGALVFLILDHQRKVSLAGIAQRSAADDVPTAP
ncbi:PLDc N-terminal domain-containing protein [Actinoalloteichus hymeniacidonis]|uniref:Phospholipase_D-nuclease N-terminal n=1 Tax=Actinoalloteichus hymeniacidonis TaxID=340345 RepID=A0AAC9HT85_9PSEU|nr:PLDc N-terminal domain-containing protein [Actinoalloteichus hymeniacidonis]AOS64914.1 Phospholipase_D-nuclease N-terminal [Actinoalloteichus hymeniacidonis]MBB5907011.1 hypothetical protein [Actinoalloteichus hymeniacidonis]